MTKFLRPGVLAICLCMVACESQEEGCVYQPDISESVNIEIEELHNDLLAVETKEELAELLNQNPVIRQVFFRPQDFPDNATMYEVFLNKFKNPHIDTLAMEIDRVYGDLSSLEADLEKAYSNLKYYYPEAKIPKVKTVASALNHDLYVSDSLIIIGLDYYLGEGAKYRPLNMFNYMLRRYAPDYIVPSIMLLKGISPEYNATNLSDNTMLTDMVAYGKSFYFAKHMMPCTPDSVIIWYSAEELAGAYYNQDIIWSHFVEEELLYENNHMVKKKYIDPRPKTYEIGEKAPGRIGTWLGWQIVRKYAEETEASLQQTMMVKDAKTIFNQAKYKPEKK